MAIKSKSLLRSNLLDTSSDELDDPMSSMGNLMDLMLVFACGLMIALVANYGVELNSTDPDIGVMEAFDAELEEVNQGSGMSDGQYMEVGTVYRDALTGQMYVVAPEDDSGEENY